MKTRDQILTDCFRQMQKPPQKSWLYLLLRFPPSLQCSIEGGVEKRGKVTGLGVRRSPFLNWLSLATLGTLRFVRGGSYREHRMTRAGENEGELLCSLLPPLEPVWRK